MAMFLLTRKLRFDGLQAILPPYLPTFPQLSTQTITQLKSLWYQVYGVQSKVSGPSQVCDVKSMESSLLLTVYDVMSIVFGHIYGVWSKRV